MATALIGLGAGIVSGIAGLFGAGGPSPEEKALTAEETQLMTNLGSAFNTRFAQQSQLLSGVNSQLSNAAFFEQPGMSAAEYAARQSGIIGSVTGATTHAVQSTLAEMSGRGGGGASSLLTGAETATIGSIEAQGALAEANLENQLTQENYAVGRELADTRVKGELSLAQLENPVPYADAASALGQVAGKQAQNTREATNASSAQKAAGWTGLATAGANALGQVFKSSMTPSITNGSEAGISDSAGASYDAWTRSLGAPSDWVPGEDGSTALGA